MRSQFWSWFAVGLLVVAVALAEAGPVWATGTVVIPLNAAIGRSVSVFSTSPIGWGSDHSTAVLAFGNYVGPQTGRTHQCRSYLWFPLDVIPLDAAIDSATLEIYVDDWPFAGAGAMGVYLVLAPWSETLTWDTRPAAGATSLVTTTITSDVAAWRAWDVTPVAREWKKGATANYGLMLASAPTPDSMVGNGWACAGPGRTSDDSAHLPRLVVVYHLPPAEIPEPATLLLLGAGLAGLAALGAARSCLGARARRP